MEEYKFPEDFKWGSATSSHQIEGNNHNDWSEWEKSKPRIEFLKSKGLNPDDFISGRACDSYNRYEEDFDIAKNLNHNIHRFSIEWSRIEPEEGRFDINAIEHYRNVIKAIKDRGMEPMVILWHFTNPVWFAKKGGFLNKKSPEYFTRYAKYVVDNLRSEVGLWITFNEPTSVYADMSYLLGAWPPQLKSIIKYNRVQNNFIKSHILAYKAIKQKQETNDTSHNIIVGAVENLSYIASGGFFKLLGIKKLVDYYRNLRFFSKTVAYLDFLGLNYYTTRRLPGSFNILPKQNKATEMNWEIYPKGIYHELKSLKKFNKPIYITENGIADKTDTMRLKFIKDHLYWIWNAIKDGVDVRGYLYWSLLDNFEWAEGFSPRFGLVEIDYATMARKIRPSAHEYAKICLTNQLEIDSQTLNTKP